MLVFNAVIIASSGLSTKGSPELKDVLSKTGTPVIL